MEFSKKKYGTELKKRLQFDQSYTIQSQCSSRDIPLKPIIFIRQRCQSSSQEDHP